MACRTFIDETGGLYWICGTALDGSQICRICGHLATKLCDYPVGDGKTCDSALCDHHSFTAAGDIDYCPEHAKEYKPLGYAEVFFIQGMEKDGNGI